jgi:hypothetical protein
MISSSTWRPKKLTNNAKGMSEANFAGKWSSADSWNSSRASSCLGGRDFEAHELVAGVEVEMDFKVGGGGFQGFLGFSASGGYAGGFDGDCPGS